MKNRIIKVAELARVEGEGGFSVKIADGNVVDVELRIPEPPRFFEAFLRGRHFSEVPDITARICGICPVAYQITSVQAIEDAFCVTVDAQLAALRRLLYCGEYIESHVLHAALLHAPDYLGYDDGFAMGKDHPETVSKALALKRIGNDLVSLLGGREIHPVNVKVGGFYQLPDMSALRTIRESLARGRDMAITLARTASAFPIPEFDVTYEFVALHHPDEYPLSRGTILTSSGLDISIREYEFHFEERHIRHSHALHSFHKGIGSYLVGPLARWNLNFSALPESVRQLAADMHLEPPVCNPFKSILVRLLETMAACDDAVCIIDSYVPPSSASVAVEVQPGLGFGASEAPRGLLYHRYRIDDDGTILDAKLVPPTAQNQPTIEADLRRYVEAHLDMPRDMLQLRCEQIIRNYDPCISCATH